MMYILSSDTKPRKGRIKDFSDKIGDVLKVWAFNLKVKLWKN